MSDQEDNLQLQLAEREIVTPLWAKISTHLEARLAMLRRKNDHMATAESTAYLRGEINALKNLLAAGENRGD